MANKKPRNFDTAVSFPASMEYYYQPATGDEQKVPHTLLVTRLETDGFIKPSAAVTKSDGQSIAFAAGEVVLVAVVTPSANMTFSIGTSSGGTQVVDSETLISGTPAVFVINTFFAASGSLYFALSTGSVSVLIKKL